MSEGNKEKIEQLRLELASTSSEDSSISSSESSDYNELELDSYLKFQRTVQGAAKALNASNKWKKDNPVTIKDVAPYYRPPQGKKSPPGCLVCLEDGKGGVARDKEGRPIICMMGMVYGSEEELKQQIAYALQRAAQYRLPHQRPDEVCFVTEVLSRETGGLSPTFRFPDAAVRSLFDFMKSYYPGSQFSVVHFCGLPSFVVGFFKMVKPFVSEEMFGRLKLKSNFSHLKKDGHIAPSSLLPHWDKEGTFQFDLTQYIEWRAQEEGIPMDQICAPGQGKSYSGGFNLNVSNIVTTQEVLGTDVGKEKVIKEGWGEKRGSGVGLFSSNRWKNKYLVLTPGLLIYFENDKISSTNHASRIITIDASSSVGRLATTKGEKRAIVCFQSAEREFTFGFSEEKEAEEWTQLLQKECEVAGGGKADKADNEGVVKNVSSLYVGDYEVSKQKQINLVDETQSQLFGYDVYV